MDYYDEPDVQVWEIPADAAITLADHSACHYHTNPLECLLAGSVVTFWPEVESA